MKMQVLFLQVRKLFFCNVFDYSLPPVRFFPPGLLLFHVRFPASVLRITDPFTHCHFFAFLLCWETICLFNFLNHLFNIHHGLVYSSISLLYFNIQRFFFFFFPRNFQRVGLFQQHHFVSLQEFSFQFTILFPSYYSLFLSLSHPQYVPPFWFSLGLLF